MCFELEEKLELLSYLTLVLIPHWIGVGDLVVYIPTPPMAIIMSIGPWATSPHARTHAEPNRAGPGSGSGGARPRLADTNAVRFRGLLNLKLFSVFLFIFYLKFYFDFLGFFCSALTHSPDLLANCMHDCVQIWRRAVTTDELRESINSFSQFSLLATKSATMFCLPPPYFLL